MDGVGPVQKLLISGGRILSGTVQVSGSKNSTLPILASSLMIPDTVCVEGVPDLADVATMTSLLSCMGTRIIREAGKVRLTSDEHITPFAPYDLVQQMRASICVLGPLLARFRQVRVAMPGGCRIGNRPIDLHLKGLAALGADLRIENGCVMARCRQLRGARIDLAGPCGSTVTGTCNVMAASVLAKGHTTILNAALEPEVVDLAGFLNSAGASITGAGTSTLEIDGVDSLHGVRHQVIPDRIEAGTLILAAAITQGNVRIERAPTAMLTSFLEILDRAGVSIRCDGSDLFVCPASEFRPVSLGTGPYPGIPTDLQAQLMAFLTLVPGISHIADDVFPERFMHAAELNRLGADIHVSGNRAEIRGVARLSGAPVMATDLRASAALVLAGLAAHGHTEMGRVHHLDRGYQMLDHKLSALGAVIRRVPDTHSPVVPRPHLSATEQLTSIPDETDTRR